MRSTTSAPSSPQTRSAKCSRRSASSSSAEADGLRRNRSHEARAARTMTLDTIATTRARRAPLLARASCGRPSKFYADKSRTTVPRSAVIATRNRVSSPRRRSSGRGVHARRCTTTHACSLDSAARAPRACSTSAATTAPLDGHPRSAGRSSPSRWCPPLRAPPQAPRQRKAVRVTIVPRRYPRPHRDGHECPRAPHGARRPRQAREGGDPARAPSPCGVPLSERLCASCSCASRPCSAMTMRSRRRARPSATPSPRRSA
jgi:hypothetical protein